MKETMVILAFGFVLYGCSTISPIPYTESAYQDKLMEWVGKDPNALILSWGPPSSTFEMPNGNKMFTWLKEKKDISVYMVGNNYQYINRNYGPISNLLSENHIESTSIVDEKRYWCQTSFVVDRDKIVGWVVKGNICLALDSKSASDAQKKLQFFSNLNAYDHVELILKDKPSDSVIFEFVAVSGYEPGAVQVRIPTNSFWTNQTRNIPFTEIISYKGSDR